MTEALTEIMICTFRRPHLGETLASLSRQKDAGPFSVIVADNDDVPSARDKVATMSGDLPYPVTYIHAPARNISIARNACLDAATADFVAFLDDDEIAAPDWLSRLRQKQRQTGADAIFGPALAVYGAQAPAWMVDQDHHSNIPKRRGEIVETGHSCNALLAWAGKPWESERFDLSRGKTGGEDTEFFFRLRQMGAHFEIAEDAIVTEDVAPNRLNAEWLTKRQFRAGQSYAVSANGHLARMKLLSTAAGKWGYCRARSALARDEASRMFWTVRAALHRGVCAGLLRLPEAELYGSSP